MNKWLGEARHLDPVGLFPAHTHKLNYMFEKREVMYRTKPDGDVPKRVAKTIKAGMDDGEKLIITPHGPLIFKVQRKKPLKQLALPT